MLIFHTKIQRTIICIHRKCSTCIYKYVIAKKSVNMYIHTRTQYWCVCNISGPVAPICSLLQSFNFCSVVGRHLNVKLFKQPRSNPLSLSIVDLCDHEFTIYIRA